MLYASFTGEAKSDMALLQVCLSPLTAHGEA